MPLGSPSSPPCSVTITEWLASSAPPGTRPASPSVRPRRIAGGDGEGVAELREQHARLREAMKRERLAQARVQAEARRPGGGSRGASRSIASCACDHCARHAAYMISEMTKKGLKVLEPKKAAMVFLL